MAEQKALNGYDLSRDFFAWAFEHPEDFRPTVSALYFYLVDLCNSLKWKEKFSVPARQCMEGMGVQSYNTFKGAFYILEKHGFIKVVKKSCNHHQANIITLLKINRVDDILINRVDDLLTDMETIKETETFLKPFKQETSSGHLKPTDY